MRNERVPEQEPAEAICGLVFAHERAKYFSVDKLSDEQIVKYAERRGLQVDELEKILARF